MDTDVVSTLAPGRQMRGADLVIAWLRKHEPALHFSTMTVMEVESGIARLSRVGSVRRRDELSDWLAGLIQQFGDRIISFDREAALIAGRMEAEALAAGRHPGLADIVIAACAANQGFVVLTRNLRHFLPLGVSAINPFQAGDST